MKKINKKKIVKKENNKKTKRIIVNLLFVLIFLGTLSFFIKEKNMENKIVENKLKESNYKIENVSSNANVENKNISKENTVNTSNVENTNSEKRYEKENIIEEYKGYDVIAKLEIPKINLETYVLKTYSEEALNVSVVKFYGADPNKEGNFCVAGHNFKNNNMFKNLKKLEKGDNLFVIDKNGEKIEYQVYDVYKVLPENVECLSQETNSKKEITLITCTNDSKKRIIIKARERN